MLVHSQWLAFSEDCFTGQPMSNLSYVPYISVLLQPESTVHSNGGSDGTGNQASNEDTKSLKSTDYVKNNWDN